MREEGQRQGHSGRVVGYKVVQSTMASLWHGGLAGRLHWAMPGGETAMPRVLCDDGAARGEHLGRGLHVYRAPRDTRRHMSHWFVPRVLVVDADERDVLLATETEIRAARWRTLAIVPPCDPREAADARWFARPGAADGMHGTAHAERVQFWAWLIGGTLATVWPVDLAALCWAALLHDAGRVNDGRDPDHGARIAERVPQLVPPHVDSAKVAYLCRWHDVGHDGNPPEWVPELLALQDADALDLHRCMRPDPARYHTDTARALDTYARGYALTGTCPLAHLAAHPFALGGPGTGG